MITPKMREVWVSVCMDGFRMFPPHTLKTAKNRSSGMVHTRERLILVVVPSCYWLFSLSPSSSSTENVKGRKRTIREVSDSDSEDEWSEYSSSSSSEEESEDVEEFSEERGEEDSEKGSEDENWRDRTLNIQKSTVPSLHNSFFKSIGSDSNERTPQSVQMSLFLLRWKNFLSATNTSPNERLFWTRDCIHAGSWLSTYEYRETSQWDTGKRPHEQIRIFALASVCICDRLGEWQRSLLCVWWNDQ